jgi:hydroxypyruvate isomerase
VLDEVDADNAFIQYDTFHAQRVEGERAATVQRLLPRTGHMQLADNPGHHEPGTGGINFEFLFAHLEGIGYTGWMGCEYKPIAGTEAGLGWRERLSPR